MIEILHQLLCTLLRLTGDIFPGLSRTKVIFQDFPGPGILKKKIQDFPGGVGTLLKSDRIKDIGKIMNG